jgi:hypothetical protein
MVETIWVLRPRDNRDGDWDPWNPWYDKIFGLIVAAETEEEARETAQENSGDETRKSRVHDDVFESERDISVWTDAKFSTCVPIEEYVEETGDDVLMKDFARA